MESRYRENNISSYELNFEFYILLIRLILPTKLLNTMGHNLNTEQSILDHGLNLEFYLLIDAILLCPLVWLFPPMEGEL